MATKPDYYEVLGVSKTATEAEIKKAGMRISMDCHPDSAKLRGKSDAEKAAAKEKFIWATEAVKVLTDSSKRATYDRYGHKGLETAGNSSTSSGPGYTEAAGPVTPRKMPTDEDTMSFFEKRVGNQGSRPTTPGPAGETSEQRRARAAEERRKNREAQRQTPPRPPESTASQPPSVSDTFRDVSEKVETITERLKGATVPVEALERFRENLKDFLAEVDAAIERARKNDNAGPRP